MKKYLITPIPFLVCWGISIYYRHAPSYDYPDPRYQFSKPGVLAYLADRWFLIGAVLTGIIISILLIEDLFEFLEKLKRRNRMEE